MKTPLFALALFLAATLGAQEAKVLSIASSDSFEVKEAWYKLREAQDQWAAVQKRVEEKYLRVPYGDKEAGTEIVMPCNMNSTSGCVGNLSSGNISWVTTTRQLSAVEEEAKAKREEQYRKEAEENRKKAHYQRRGWENGFEFSSDFKYIVPKPAPVINYQDRGVFLTPAITH